MARLFSLLANVIVHAFARVNSIPRANAFARLARTSVLAATCCTTQSSALFAQDAASETKLEEGLALHFPFRGDLKERVRGFEPEGAGGIELNQASNSARFKLSGRRLTIPQPQVPKLGTGDFTIATWVRCDESDGFPTGDLISHYSPKERRGFHLSIKTATGVTTTQSNYRNLQFGIDDNRDGTWRDCGRPGEAILAFSLAVHNGDLYAGTCEPGANRSGRVYRYGGDQKWVDCGAPDQSNSVTSLAEYRGKLYAATGKYRLAGSALTESGNTNLGGGVYRYEGDQRWVLCGEKLPNTEAVGGLVVFRDRLYASSLYKPAGFFSFDPESNTWTSLPIPQSIDPTTQQKTDRRVEAMFVYDDAIYASSYDGGHVYRYDDTWTDYGRLADNTQTYSFVNHYGGLYVGTWPSGRVYSLKYIGQWIDEGRLGEELEVMGMAVHNGRLFAGTLPLAEVYAYDGQFEGWKRLTRLDSTPDVKYRRAWTMAEHKGELFCSTLPSGKVFAFTQGKQIAWDHPFPPGWHHVAATRSGNRLALYLDGKQVAESPLGETNEKPYDLTHDRPLQIGTGANGTLNGELSDLRIYTRQLTPSELTTLTTTPPSKQ